MPLYLVGTPIGNLEDITPRALRVLRDVSLIAAEDTRTAKQLLAHFEIRTPVTSYYEQNKMAKLDRIMEALQSGDVAVVSEAGMPGLSDPGYELVLAAIERGIPVVPVPGPSAILAALVASGLAVSPFYYLGFIPREPQQRRRLLRTLVDETMTVVAFEAPHRLRDTLKDMEEILGARPICVAREMTKVFEEFRRGTIPEVRRHFETVEPRGEFTLVLGGAERTARAAPAWDDERVRREVKRLVRKGLARTEAVKQVAREAGRERREVYELTAGKK